MSRLAQVSRDHLTIRRVRKGRGFAFCGAEGAIVDDACKARAKALAIPPAWTDVRIAMAENAHIQALGVDALALLAPGGSVTARKRKMAEVTRQVADFLRNTPAISRKSYIAPKLFDLFEKGRLRRMWQAAETGGGGGLRQRERRLGAVLSLMP